MAYAVTATIWGLEAFRVTLGPLVMELNPKETSKEVRSGG